MFDAKRKKVVCKIMSSYSFQLTFLNIDNILHINSILIISK